MRVPGRKAHRHFRIETQIADCLAQAIVDEHVVISEVDCVFADRAADGADDVGNRAEILRLAEIADRQPLGDKAIDDLPGAVGRGVVGNDDLVLEGELVEFDEVAERLFEEGRAVIGGNADAQLNLAHSPLHCQSHATAGLRQTAGRVSFACTPAREQRWLAMQRQGPDASGRKGQRAEEADPTLPYSASILREPCLE
ncbi:hypothetical protein D9M70_507900 [compost metagenome]